MNTILRIALCTFVVGADAAAATGSLETPVRVGTHPGFSRVVFDMPPGADFQVVTEANRLLVVFSGAGQVREPPSVPRNVRAIQTGLETATLELAPGTRTRSSRLGERLVIDILDSGAGRPSAPNRAIAQKRPASATGPQNGSDFQPKPAAAVAPEAAPVRSVMTTPLALPAPLLKLEPQAVDPRVQQPAEDVIRPAAVAPLMPVKAEDLPLPGLSDAIQRAAEPRASDMQPSPGLTQQRPAFIVNADLDVGAAAFRRDDHAVVVLDRRMPPQALPPGVKWTTGATTTVLHLSVARNDALILSRTATGWSVNHGVTEGNGTSMRPVDRGLGLGLPRPGRVVTVLDPIGGGTLLVGTSLAPGPDTFVAQGRRTPDYRLLPSWLGVVVESTADRVELRTRADGFAVLGVPAPSTEPLLAQTRRFDLPNEPSADTMNRMRAQMASAAASPARARSRDRLAAVQSLLALGLGTEAQSLIQVIVADDPQSAADAQTVGLGAMAAILAGRPGDAEELDDARLNGSDEIALWRGLRDRQIGRSSLAADNLGAFAPLAASYPAPLRRRIWSDVAEAAVEAGQPLPSEPLPPLIKAIVLEREGKVEAALVAYDAVAAGRDRLAQVRAAARAAELRLSTGQIKPLEAAAIMERQSLAWRGDAREATFRMRAAELQAAAGQWRPALAALRLLENAFPEQKAEIQTRKAGVMSMMLSVAGSELAALDVVLLATEYADAVPDGPAGVALARLLASKLTALDLPARAIPILQGLMQAAAPGEARAEFGLRLAQLLMDCGDEAGARTALDGSLAADIPAALQEARGLIHAKLKAAAGDGVGAANTLIEIGTERAHDLRATLLAKAGDWRGASAALADLASLRVPKDGPLSDAAQDVLVRQASAAMQLPDPQKLRELARSVGRLEGARADLFRTLTAAPVDGAADLPRASRELAALRTLPQQLQTIGSR